MTDLDSAIAETNEQGFAVVPRYFTPHTLGTLNREYERIERGEASLGSLFRRSAIVREIAFDVPTLGLAKSIVGEQAMPVAAFFLNKTQDSNWALPWHQNTRVAVDAFFETEGYSGWSNESGIMHVVPPARILEQMLIVRFNMDDSDAANGGLQVLPGTHQDGVLNPEDLAFRTRTIVPVYCDCPAGSVTLMKALTVHRSDPSRTSRNRRILQIEYCGEKLHGKLNFYDLAAVAGEV